MGSDYSSCLGYERNKQLKCNLVYQNQQFEAWTNPDVALISLNPARADFLSNEKYIVKKQDALNLHLIPCIKLKQRIEALCDGEFD